jgi:hypothetical protein
VALPPGSAPVELNLFERDSAFEALIERRLQVRVESPIALHDVGVIAELEIDGHLIVRSYTRIEKLPATIDEGAPLFTSLYSDTVRGKLLEAGTGTLRFAVGRLVKIEVQLERPAASVDWSYEIPEIIGGTLVTELVSASAQSPTALPRRTRSQYLCVEPPPLDCASLTGA